MSQSCTLQIRIAASGSSAEILLGEARHNWVLRSMLVDKQSGGYLPGHSVGLSPTGTACVRRGVRFPTRSDVIIWINEFLLMSGIPPALRSGTGTFMTAVLPDFPVGRPFDWTITRLTP